MLVASYARCGPSEKVVTISCVDCTLLPVRNGWVAECGLERHGPYLSKGMAFRVAAAEARALRQSGSNVRIAIQDENGDVSTAFCLCKRFQRAVSPLAN